jgi:hypothetical protein
VRTFSAGKRVSAASVDVKIANRMSKLERNQLTDHFWFSSLATQHCVHLFKLNIKIDVNEQTTPDGSAQPAQLYQYQ